MCLALRSQSRHRSRQIIYRDQSYVDDSDPEEDPKEDFEDGPVDYPADGGDGDDDDPSDDDEEEKEASEEEEAEEEEEEHQAPADSIVTPVVDHVPSSEKTKPFETDESAPTARSPQTIIIATDSEHHTSRYDVGESSAAAPRPAGGHRIDYRFIGTLDAETRRQRAEEVGYRIRDTWEQDTQDIYAMIEDAQDRQTWIFQSVETLIDDRQYHYELAMRLDPHLDAGSPYRCAGFIDSGPDRIGSCTAEHLADGAMARFEHVRLEIKSRAKCYQCTGSSAIGLLRCFIAESYILSNDERNDWLRLREAWDASKDLEASGIGYK
ncbi:hypothetical protein Tco_1185935 [Tanacetum coccineum]